MKVKRPIRIKKYYDEIKDSLTYYYIFKMII